ncbi:MAG TPA: hypothetical protein DET40_02305 [Lentisphaeria bacterium]|nr:MAG: hypothetical protein A2X45_16905 [Lentisphaerae bacterium GWF2_50_93]HCE42364.1 hypothetical protein [Lentisphaeria bacterium]
MKARKIAGKGKGCAYCASGCNRNATVIGRYGSNVRNKLMKCRHCGRKYSETYGTVFSGSRLTPNQLRSVLRLMFMGMSIRETALTLKLAPDTVFRARNRLKSHLDAEILSIFRRMGFTKVLKKGLAKHLAGQRFC